ncbi:MAG: NAD(P)-binding domain-containing protein, partial [Prolixibacteraceae bacterium]|nr:NAD(P)-binding domain-containing protein [Burkholderiales bacterium]
YEVVTDQSNWRCESVVVATGACNTPVIPTIADAVPSAVKTLTPLEYRNPQELEEGGVLVVGASASGIQIADEIRRSGRSVTLAVGEHVRVPRVYRGKDIKWWMDASGVLDQRYDEVDDIVRARNVPSLQLAGYADRRTIELNSLTALGVKLVGRLAGICEGKAQFSGSLRNVCALADLKMNRLLGTFDDWARDSGYDGVVAPPPRFEATVVEESPPLLLDLTRGRIKTIIWATGFRPDYSWLDVPVLDNKGYIRHDGGVVDVPGLYLLGMPFLRRRKSSLIDGVGDDARDLSAHLASYLGDRALSRPELIAARG